MTGGCFGCHWALEADKYDYLDEDIMEAEKSSPTSPVETKERRSEG